jgi:hypothetical protein
LHGRQILDIFEMEATAPEQGSPQLRFPALAHGKWRHGNLLQQKSARVKLGLSVRNHVRPAGLNGVQVNAPRQRGKQSRTLSLPAPQKIGHIAAGFQHQGAAEFTIQWMFHYNVDHPDPVIYQDVQLFLGSLRGMLARENGTVRRGPRTR